MHLIGANLEAGVWKAHAQVFVQIPLMHLQSKLLVQTSNHKYGLKSKPKIMVLNFNLITSLVCTEYI